jgi:hypothetical protein
MHHVRPIVVATDGDPDELLPLFDDVGLVNVDLVTEVGRARFPSVSTMVRAEVDAWGLGEAIDGAEVAHLLHQADQALASRCRHISYLHAGCSEPRPHRRSSAPTSFAPPFSTSSHERMTSSSTSGSTSSAGQP